MQSTLLFTWMYSPRASPIAYRIDARERIRKRREKIRRVHVRDHSLSSSCKLQRINALRNDNGSAIQHDDDMQQISLTHDHIRYGHAWHTKYTETYLRVFHINERINIQREGRSEIARRLRDLISAEKKGKRPRSIISQLREASWRACRIPDARIARKSARLFHSFFFSLECSNVLRVTSGHCAILVRGKRRDARRVDEK